jgi:hypothetical protein
MQKRLLSHQAGLGTNGTWKEACKKEALMLVWIAALRSRARRPAHRRDRHPRARGGVVRWDAGALPGSAELPAAAGCQQQRNVSDD